MSGFLRSVGLVLACGLMLASCSGGVDDTPVEPLEETRRQISQGELVGFETAQGAHAWLAVPYAAPPVGELRWRAPRPAEMFDGPLQALAHGARSPIICSSENLLLRIVCLPYDRPSIQMRDQIGLRSQRIALGRNRLQPVFNVPKPRLTRHAVSP